MISKLQNFEYEVVVLVLDFSPLEQVFFEGLGAQVGQLVGFRFSLVNHALNVEQLVQVLLVPLVVAIAGVSSGGFGPSRGQLSARHEQPTLALQLT